MWWRETEVRAPAAAAWDLLVDLDRWPGWGPSVRAARLDDGGRRLHAGARGDVQTPVGLWIPFRVTDWDEGRAWAWRVAGVPATSHRVERSGPDRCRVAFGVPLWAPAYLVVVTVALGRIGNQVTGRRP